MPLPLLLIFIDFKNHMCSVVLCDECSVMR